MDFFKQQFARIVEQIGTLNASQKMLAASLVAIMLMTLIWWGRYSGQAEMEPILDQDFAVDDIARITTQLASRGINSKTAGNRILVPADRKMEVIATLSYEHLMPANTQTGIDDLIAKMSSPWDSATQQDHLFNRKREMMLSEILRRWPRVQDANVFIDPHRERGFGSTDIQPTASVNLTLKSGEKPDDKLADGAADFVAGAIAGMTPGQIKVLIDGARWAVHESEDPGQISGNDVMDNIRSFEKYYTQKIRDHFNFIEGIVVSVTVEPNTKLEKEEETSYDKKKSANIEQETETQTSENSSGGHSAGGEAGVVPNVGASVAPSGSGGGGGGTSTDSTEKAKMLAGLGSRHVSIIQPAGGAVATGASVRVPRSYFAQVYKRLNGSTREPDEAVLRPVIDAELAHIRNDVKACTNIKSDDAVVVSDYTDLLPTAPASPQAAASTISLAVTSHGKEIALAALAVISLFLVSMMVKRSGPSPALAAALAATAAAENTATVNKKAEEEVGEVGEGDPMLDGVELDEEAVRSQQVVEQVSTLVKENPDAAANLVKRWLNRS